MARQEVRIAGRKLVLTRVVPPRIPVRRAFPTEPLAVLSPTQVSEIERRAQMEHRTFFLSATVYDRKLTELRWWHEGSEYTAWSNIDFNHLVGVGEFEAGNVVYSTMTVVTNQSASDLPASEESESDASVIRSLLPDLPAAQGRSVFVVTANIPPDEGEAVLAPIDALHAYYDVNAARLRIEAQRNEALHAARERHREKHPAPSKDTRIYFWPVRGSAYQGVNR